MQIRLFTDNGVNVTANKTIRAKEQSVQTAGSLFGAQCRVTISCEGRKLNEQSKTRTVQSAQSIKAEKMLLRQQEQSSEMTDAKNEYLELLEEINSKVNALNHSYESREDMETSEKKKQLIEAMREQKQKQLEENQRNAKEAQQLAMQSSMQQDEVDKNNRDLLIMLKSIEESERYEEEREENGNGAKEGAQTENGGDAENSVGEVIRNAAGHFVAASARREMNVTSMIRALNEDGHNYIDKANEIIKAANDGLENMKRLLTDEGTSDADKKQAVYEYNEMMASGYNDAYIYRRRGIQEIKDARDCKINHIADNPLQGVEETKKSMMQSAVDAVLNEASQGKIDEASQELEDEVEELIDRRNDVSHVEADEEEEPKTWEADEADETADKADEEYSTRIV